MGVEQHKGSNCSCLNTTNSLLRRLMRLLHLNRRSQGENTTNLSSWPGPSVTAEHRHNISLQRRHWFDLKCNRSASGGKQQFQAWQWSCWDFLGFVDKWATTKHKSHSEISQETSWCSCGSSGLLMLAKNPPMKMRPWGQAHSVNSRLSLTSLQSSTCNNSHLTRFQRETSPQVRLVLPVL